MLKTTLQVLFSLHAGLCIGVWHLLWSRCRNGQVFSIAVNQLSPREEEAQASGPEPTGKRTSILVLGSDEREGETASRSDTIILVTVDPDLKKIAVVSIPRDTRGYLKQWPSSQD